MPPAAARIPFNTMASVIWSILAIIAGTYLVLLGYCFWFQADLLYFPGRTLSLTPVDIGLPYRDITLHAPDGTAIAAWYIPAEPARGTILFCHGNAGNISHRLESIALFNRLGFSTFIFDYRGYGRSQGQPSETGTYEDGEAAWDYLVTALHSEPDRIVIMGESLGGAIAAYLAQHFRPAALVLNSAFTSLPELGARIYPWLPVAAIARFKYPTLKYLSGVTCPVLIVYSLRDEIIPLSQSRRLAAGVPGLKQVIELPGSHNEALAAGHKDYQKGLERFLMSLHLSPAHNPNI